MPRWSLPIIMLFIIILATIFIVFKGQRHSAQLEDTGEELNTEIIEGPETPIDPDGDPTNSPDPSQDPTTGLESMDSETFNTEEAKP